MINGEFPKKTLREAFNDTVKTYPNNLSIIFNETTISYDELRENAKCFAYGLSQLGLRKGDHIGIWMPNCTEWISAMLGIAWLGGVIVPINTRYRAYELEYIFNHSDIKTLVMIDTFLSINLISILKDLCPEINVQDSRNLELKKFPILKKIICFKRKINSQDKGLLDYQSLIDMGRERIPEFIKFPANVSPHDPLMIQYTSGTTSFPKGAILTHDNILRDAFYFSKRLRITPKDRYHAAMPFFHVGGTTLTIITSLITGSCLVVQETWDPGQALKLISDYQCTVTAGMDSMFKMMCDRPDFKNYDISRLRTGWIAGHANIIKEARIKLGFKPIHIYGLTEASPNVTTSMIDDPEDVAIFTQGKPHAGLEIKIIDIHTGETLPNEKEGEICVRGWNIMKGYYKQPEQTARAIDAEGWLHTGDLGIIEEHGNLRFTGRTKDMIKPGGENVAAAEVENYLSNHPKVSLAAVVGVPDDRLGEAICTFIKTKEGESCSVEEILDYCKGKIANFKVPKYVFFVNEFPVSTSNKIQKFVLKETAIEKLKLFHKNST